MNKFFVSQVYFSDNEAKCVCWQRLVSCVAYTHTRCYFYFFTNPLNTKYLQTGKQDMMMKKRRKTNALFRLFIKFDALQIGILLL